ncbi:MULTISPECIES: PepSY-associated TM helix domain-containing protein [Chitinophagaceae]
MKHKYSFRKIINTLHLWVGIPSALVLFIVCLTGTPYVFQKEMTQWVDSDQYTTTIPAHTPILRLDSLAGMVVSPYQDLQVTTVLIPEKKDAVWQFTVAPRSTTDTGASKSDIKKRTRTLLVNPYTGRVQGDTKSICSQFFAKVIELHRWMLLDHSVGAVITITSAFLFLFLEISGIILWLPAKLKNWKKWKAWKPGFTIKRKAHWKRVNHDLHRALGFYSFFFITIMALTGPYFAYDWYRNGFAGVFGTKPVKKEVANNTKTVKEKTAAATALLDNILL